MVVFSHIWNKSCELEDRNSQAQLTVTLTPTPLPTINPWNDLIGEAKKKKFCHRRLVFHLGHAEYNSNNEGGVKAHNTPHNSRNIWRIHIPILIISKICNGMLSHLPFWSPNNLHVCFDFQTIFSSILVFELVISY